MALDFSDIKDEKGAAVYLLHSGHGSERRLMDRFAERLKETTKSQVILLSVKERDGARVAEFYGLRDFPAILIVRDNDEIAHSWFGQHLPNVREVTHLVDRIG